MNGRKGGCTANKPVHKHWKAFLCSTDHGTRESGNFMAAHRAQNVCGIRAARGLRRQTVMQQTVFKYFRLMGKTRLIKAGACADGIPDWSTQQGG